MSNTKNAFYLAYLLLPSDTHTQYEVNDLDRKEKACEYAVNAMINPQYFMTSKMLLMYA